NLHACGTIEMMKAALAGLVRADGTRPLLVAVTQLTSTNAVALRDELLIESSMEETVLHYANNAKTAGLDGIVCSPHESKKVKSVCGSSFITVTPGIRFSDNITDDQKRIMTPAMARENGSDFIVVGRPITQASDPVAAYERCVREFLN
ncbi:MAG: orotidine-5'-phosphate decarboxylase, partial [Oscillospiraceae bacterium]